MGAMVSAVDLEGKSVDDVVAEWMSANEDRWSTWIQ
jgi:glycine betaine/proline transport system substrate-binding protein